MVGLKRKDITKEVLLIFTICYEYSLNFTNVLKLYKISRKYFWTFMEVCNPMLKMGTRKAINIRKSVEKMLPYAQSLYTGATDLTPREDSILQTFNWFVQDSFSDGEGCLHVSQLSVIPFVKAYRNDGSMLSSNFKTIERDLDDISYITLGEDKYPKTSRMLFYLEKYAGDINVRDLDTMSVRDMVHKIQDGREAVV